MTTALKRVLFYTTSILHIKYWLCRKPCIDWINMSDLRDWYYSVPFFTRNWLGLTVLFSLLGRFNIVDPLYLIITYESVVNRFHIWRLFTSVFFYPLDAMTGLHFLFNCYFLCNYSSRLESSVYSGRPADYAFLLLFSWICTVICALMFKFYFLMDCLVMTVLYIWCQLNKEIVVNFWFGTSFKAMYLPWVLFAFNFIINSRGLVDIIGIVIGHLFFFLSYQYPLEFNGASLLKTPAFLYKVFPNERVISRFGQTPIRRAPTSEQEPRRTGHNWGQGHVLGGR